MRTSNTTSFKRIQQLELALKVFKQLDISTGRWLKISKWGGEFILRYIIILFKYKIEAIIFKVHITFCIAYIAINVHYILRNYLSCQTHILGPREGAVGAPVIQAGPGEG